MSISIVLKFGQGSFERDGFPVTLKVLENGRPFAQVRNCPEIPAAPQIPERYQDFQASYKRLGKTRGIELVQDQTTHISSQQDIENCRNAERNLKEEVECWFEHHSFRFLEAEIRANVTQATRGQTIPLIIDADTGNNAQDIQLRKLPWHLWRMFTHILDAEPVLAATVAPQSEPLRRPVKILAIFGSNEGELDLSHDEQLFVGSLEQIGAEFHPVRQPTWEQIHVLLSDNAWDILFFAGHSASHGDCRSGFIQISYQIKQLMLQIDKK